MSGGHTDCCDAAPEILERSVLGCLDPRVRLGAVLAFILALLSIQGLPDLFIAVLLSLALVPLAGQPMVAIGHRLLHVEGFMLVLFLLLPFSTPGETVFSIGSFSASKEGLLHACVIALKANASVIAVFALLGSMEPARLGYAMAGLGFPYKLVHLFLFTVRYMGVFRGEMERLLEAMRARAFVPSSTWHTWRAYGNLAGMILIRSLDRAERIEEAMRCRAFNGRYSLAADGRLTWRDAVCVSVTAGVVAGLIGAGHFL
jgi:cobalt/nickel transport system permease protein